MDSIWSAALLRLGASAVKVKKTGTVRTYNVTLSRVRATTVAVEKQYYMF